ncbi:MMPL family transporter [Actinomadura darangshiensis]|uniref:MMPL family transporter n=1 Tax=Actinomadura darangshiensis TaxID=705336 RepID=A0A4R5BXL9_9ACTN|nr:MMPL family transporter [Actinomadura darangshiensis]TDD89114.1 MMPL family transporter [Actinomadura darangshiensis]
MRRWAELMLAHRRLVMVFWLVVAIAGGAVSGQVTERMTTDYSLPGEPGSETAEQITRTFGNGGYTAPYLVTLSLPEGRTVAGDQAGVAAVFAHVQAEVPNVRVLDQATTGDPAFVTEDGRTAYAMVFFQYETSATAKIPTDEIHRALDAAKPPGTTIGVTGESVLGTGSESEGPGILIEVLIGSVGALAVLAFVFASMLAFLPLIIAAASILATFALLLPLSELGTFSALVQFLIALIGLGVAIDYSLLVVTRWREERHRGADNHEAVVIATQTAGHAVVFSGVTVAIGLLALLVLPVPFMRSLGVGGALIPLASVAATLTLTPAILGSVGPRWDWPRIRREDSASRTWSRWASLMVRRRWIAAGVSIVALLALVGAFTGIRVGMSSSDSLAESGPAYEALATLERGGVTTGNLTPIEVLASTGRARSVAAELGRVPGIERALVPHGPASNRAGKTVVVLIPDEETVNSKSVDTVRDVIDRAERTPGVLGVTGTGTAQIDFLNAVYGNFPLMLALIALLTYVLLVRAFRSLLLPLKAVLFNLLSMGATFGLIVLFWQQGIGSDLVFGVSETGAVTFWVPLTVFAFLYGLSMDYEVFILARMREEYDASGSTTTAIVQGIGRTGRLVTSAALILFLAFAALASSPGTDLKVMATGLGFGILLDATIVRSMLLPSLVSLMGTWNWYLPESVAKILRVKPSRPATAPPRPEPTRVG